MRRAFLCVFLITLAVVLEATAQLKVYPVKRHENLHKKSTTPTAREASESRQLPFWDDFSTPTEFPDSTLWEDSQNVYISAGLGINPPSINVASFDGLKGDGLPHISIPSSIGRTDSLKSCPLELGDLSVSDNVYISFFYQFAGFGDEPDDTDSIRLEFLNADTLWQTVWPSNNAELNRTGDFTQVLVKVDDDMYFHDNFRFKFQAFGRQSGPFDVWSIDYVYVNEGRGVNDTSYPDRAISTAPTSIFKNYYSIPRAHFDDTHLNESSFVATNLDLDDIAGQPFSIDVESTIVNYLEGESTSSLATISAYAPPSPPSSQSPLDPGDYDTLFVPNIIPPGDFTEADSTFLEYKITLRSDDEIDVDYDPAVYGPYSFTINDTVTSNYTLKDFYAYDDGTAELGAAMNFSGSQLAYLYDILSDTIEYITAFDIYFPFVNTSPDGKSINLMIWESLDDEQDNVLYRQTINISKEPGINQFTRFNLGDTIAVSDSIFIGYRQNTAGDLAVGLDKNSDSGDKIFVNLNGEWEQNDFISGSLMFRPVFGPPPSVIVGTDPEITSQIRIFPNPTTGMITITGGAKQIEIYTLNGAKLKTLQTSVEKGTKIDLNGFSKGIYIIKLLSGKELITRKIIKH